MNNFTRFIVSSYLAFACALPAAISAPVPAPAEFAHLFLINDVYEGTTPVDTGVVGSTTPVNLQENYTSPRDISTMDLSATASATAGGIPITNVELSGTSISVGEATGQASAALSYQVVITGPGTPGDLVGVNFSALGSLTNESPCTVCLPSTLSSSALLRVYEGSYDYFQLGDYLEGTASSSLFQSGIGTKAIDVNTTLMLPIETQINIQMGVSAFGETKGMFFNPGIDPPDDISIVAMLDPTFTPTDSNYSVLVSSNLTAVPLPAAVWLFASALGLIGCFIRPRVKARDTT